MRYKTLNTIEILVHAFCWISFTILFIHFNAMSFHYLQGDLMDLPILFGTFINIILFYFNFFYLFPRYKSRKINIIGYSLSITVLVVVLSVIENSFDYLYAVFRTKENAMTLQLQVGELLFTSFVNLFFILVSVLYSIIRDWLKMDVIKRKLTEQNLKLELNFLKSQISPHFLFNSLNNLYSIAIKNDDQETASGLSKLSTMMRFMLDKSDKTIVELNEEIKYLKSYIEMQKLRFLETDDIKISFNAFGNTNQFNLPPFLLINFIENAFKHGIDYKNPSNIGITLTVDENTLLFKVENTIHRIKKNVDNSKLGLDNVKKRLDLIYGTDYSLRINPTSENYIVELTLKSL